MNQDQPVCVIVGAGAGLGRALAARFAREGYTLALVSRSAAGSAAALAAAQEAGPGLPHQWFAGDAARPEALEQAVVDACAQLGPAGVMIYNPRSGYQLRAPLEMSYDDLDGVFRLEVMGAHAAARAVMPAMIKQGRGSVIFSSATAALRGSPTNPLYAIGKFGVRALSQSLAKAYAKDGVHVAHIRLDCTLDVPETREWLGDDYDKSLTSDCDDVADSYWWMHTQPRSAWTNELEIRPYTETWTF